MPYVLLAHPRAQRELDELPSRIADGLRAVLQELATRPRDPKFDLKKLNAVDGEPPALRLRVGEYRVILRIDMRTVKFCRSICDVEARSRSGRPNAATF